jgi:hypothetical protein
VDAFAGFAVVAVVVLAPSRVVASAVALRRPFAAGRVLRPGFAAALAAGSRGRRRAPAAVARDASLARSSSIRCADVRRQLRPASARGIALRRGLVEQHRAATAALSDPIRPCIGIRTRTSVRRRTAGERPLPSTADDDGQWPTQVRRPRRERRIAVRSHDPDTACSQIGQRTGQVIDGAERQVFDGSGARLDRRRRERCLAMRREIAPWTPAASAERRSVPTFCGSSRESSTSTNGGSPRSLRAREYVIERRPDARLDDERDALVAVEPGDRRQAAALDLETGMRRLVAWRTSFSSAARRCGTTSSRFAGGGR